VRRVQCQRAVEKRGEPPNTCKTLVERVGWLLEYEELRGINKGGDSTEAPRHLVRGKQRRAGGRGARVAEGEAGAARAARRPAPGPGGRAEAEPADRDRQSEV